MARRQQKKGAPRDRRAEVLDAARHLSFRKGYRGTTIQQIADRAGYSKRTVYLDFETKDALFMTICAEGGALILGALREIPADELPFEQLIDAFQELFIAFSRDHSEYFRMIFSEATPEIIANCSPAVRDEAARVEHEAIDEESLSSRSTSAQEFEVPDFE